MSNLAAILAVPQGTEFSNLHDDIQSVIDGLFVGYYKEPSNVVDGKDLRRIHMAPPQVDGVTYIQALNALIASFGLDWEILHLQDYGFHYEVEMVDGEEVKTPAVTHYHTDKDRLAQFRLTEWDYDENGQIPGSDRPRPIGGFASKQFRELRWRDSEGAAL